MEENKEVRNEALDAMNETPANVEDEQVQQSENLIEETASEETDVEKPDEETISSEPIIIEESVEKPDEETITSETIIIEESVEKPDEETVSSETIIIEESVEKPDEETVSSETIIIEESVEKPDEEAEITLPVVEYEEKIDLVIPQEVLLSDDYHEEVAEAAEALAAEFDKELLSAKDQPKQAEDELHEEDEEVEKGELVPDYHSCDPEELIETLRTLINENPLENIKGRVSAIKLAFLEHERAARSAAKAAREAIQEVEGEEKEEVVEFVYPLSARFNEVFDLYRQKKAKFMEDLEKEKEVNLESKNKILEELRELLVSEQPLKVTYDRFRELQEQWKGIGIVPKQEIATLWNNYHFLIEKFFDKVRIHRELKELDLKKNLELKIALCEKAEELLLEEKVVDAFKKLQDYHKQWREIGAVPNSHREDIWERFKMISDTVNQRHREYFDSLHSEYESNMQAKTAICDKLEEIVATPCTTVGEWNKKTDELNELFKLWKSIGPIGKKQSDELWERFSKSMDAFYKNKKEYFQKIKEMSMDNYNQKLNLCVEAEAMKDSTDWKKTSRDFVRLQEEWRNIGPVPVKLSDKIWKRFRAACDHFFNTKESYFSEITAAEPENLKAKEALIEELKNYTFSEDKAENLDKLKDFQRRWMAIGFVPIKEKERLQTEYRQVLNEKMKKLNISSYEFSGDESRSYYNRGGGSFSGQRRFNEGENGLRKEINYLQNKIATMQDEVNLWENNIGFLSSSKNADILKQEFEKKIQKSKNELELNNAKLRQLRQELAKEEEEKKSVKQ